MDAPFFNDKEAQIRKDSITIDWTPLEDADAGGVGYSIDEYVIKYKLANVADDEDDKDGSVKVSGEAREWTHEGLVNGEEW